MKRSRGYLSKTTRKILKLKRRLKITDYLKRFEIGERVAIDIKPRREGMPHRRYQGKVGTIVGKRGDCYEIKVRAGNKEKLVIVHPVHLKKVS